MKIAVAQISCSLGDPEANLIKVRDFSRLAKEAGAELIVFPEMTDTGYSVPVIRAHAGDWKTGFASNRVGKNDDLWFCGSSAIIDPRGVVIAAASADREELIQVETLEDAVKSVRGQMEVFAHRRPDVYR
jgi:predicted amidohydrolase